MLKALLFLSLILILPVTASQKATGANFCTLTRTLDEKDLYKDAGIIFKGKFVDFEVKENKKGLLVRKLKFEVSEGIKGLDSKSKTLVLKELANSSTPFTNKLIAKDKQYVFFFFKPSRLGLTSLVGMEQGFVEVDESGKLLFSKRLKKSKSSSTNYDELKKRCK
ncbi:MAG: hypothetical protein LW817_07705 [Candidatus Caenarcaniphilales bacterium]|jgi:hypothetical protein|nr:hypothetical protein [Candidatus Caenarcaniphilales bacterium]